MAKRKRKATILDIVDKVIDSDLPISTRNAIVKHYLLPGLGTTLAPVQMKETGVGGVGRPNAEEIFIEGNPILKAGEEATEELMGGVKDDEE